MHAFISTVAHGLFRGAGILSLLAVFAIVLNFVRSERKQGNPISWREEYGWDEVVQIAKNLGSMIRRGFQYIWHHPPGGFRSSVVLVALVGSSLFFSGCSADRATAPAAAPVDSAVYLVVPHFGTDLLGSQVFISMGTAAYDTTTQYFGSYGEPALVNLNQSVLADAGQSVHVVMFANQLYTYFAGGNNGMPDDTATVLSDWGASASQMLEGSTVFFQRTQMQTQQSDGRWSNAVYTTRVDSVRGNPAAYRVLIRQPKNSFGYLMISIGVSFRCKADHEIVPLASAQGIQILRSRYMPVVVPVPSGSLECLRYSTRSAAISAALAANMNAIYQ